MADAPAKVCGNCQYAEVTEIKFNGKLHSTYTTCMWGKMHPQKRVPYWMNKHHQTHEEMPRTKRGCDAFVAKGTPSAPSSEVSSPERSGG